MEIPNKKQHEDLPYEKLALLGIDRDSADKLPQDIKQKLLGGEVTPLLNVSIKAHNGTIYHSCHICYFHQPQIHFAPNQQYIEVFLHSPDSRGIQECG